MPISNFHVPKLSLVFAKIVANPTALSWSQVYNAGSLFAALSLTQTQDNNQDLILPAVGKNLFNNLEAEFFSLEEKNLYHIKTAIEKSLESLPPGIIVDACLAYFKDDVLYLFIVGKGKIIMKRGGSLGILLEKKSAAAPIMTASGYLRANDIIILQTDRFTQNVSEDYIVNALKLQRPNDIAESLSPHVHAKEDGSQAAIIIAYNGTVRTIPDIEDNSEKALTKAPPLKPSSPVSTISPPKFLAKLNSFIPRLTRLQKISICAGVLLLIILSGTIIFTKSKQDNAKYAALYQEIYTQAQKNYDSAIALKKLNQSHSISDFKKAEQILVSNMNKFKTGSNEESKLREFLTQIQREMGSITKVNKISPKNITLSTNHLFNIEINHKAVSYAQDTAAIYLLTDDAVSAINKATLEKKKILTNNNDWSEPIAISTYQGNIYILDKKAGILKFTPTQAGLTKTDYFKEATPDLSKASSMAIDGSIWILTLDGKIFKYTRGKQDNFTISGLEKPLSNPLKIFTDIDTSGLYILDNGNSRIVKLEKTGAYQNQYNADILQSAKDFEILEANPKALILENNKIWELPL